MNNFVSQKAANQIRQEIVDDYAEKLTLKDEEKEKANEKWFGRGLIEKLEEPIAEKVITAKCPKGHSLEATPREKPWLCQGSSKWKPRCCNGSHNSSSHYSCTVESCTSWDGLCEEHFHLKTKEAVSNDKASYMTSYILNRYNRPTRHISPPRPNRGTTLSFR